MQDQNEDMNFGRLYTLLRWTILQVRETGKKQENKGGLIGIETKGSKGKHCKQYLKGQGHYDMQEEELGTGPSIAKIQLVICKKKKRKKEKARKHNILCLNELWVQNNQIKSKHFALEKTSGELATFTFHFEEKKETLTRFSPFKDTTLDKRRKNLKRHSWS